jgi:hypothetical protein
LRTRLHLLSALALVLASCAFDDHTVGSLGSAEDFFTRAPREGRRAAAKFIVTRFDEPAARELRYYDSNFYALHDEWYWFRLLNGQSIPGLNVPPVDGLSFGDVKSIYLWAEQQSRLPLDLRWVEGDRLYSPYFYDLGVFRKPLRIGIGTLMHIDGTDTQPERWVFFLEYVHQPTYEEVVAFFESLEATLPADISAQVLWAVRSPGHETLAAAMEAQGLRFSDRLIRFKDLAAAGETEVYNGGLTAGRLLKLAPGEDTGRVDPSDILLVEQVPDELPPSAGLLSAEPQTPLAHVNLLAKNRRIPNAYQGGIADDVQMELWAAYRTPVLVLAETPATLVVKAISEGEYENWRSLGRVVPASVPGIDVSQLPYVYDLTAHSLSEVDALRPAVGGKAAGFLALLAGAPPESVPPNPLALSIRGYKEHLEPLRPLIVEMLDSPDFKSNPRARALALEGTIMYPQHFPTRGDVAYAVDFLVKHTDDALGQLARAGGVVGRIRAQPIEPATLEEITDALRTQFAGYASNQALRFRSSSTAEDIEGFNGAGLYESATGFIDAARQPREKDQARTVEAAITWVWSSYWRVTAFDERALEGIEHLSGNMGMVVHARHDDEKELANGVVLFTFLPPESPDESVFELNVQLGAESVTNPTAGGTALPEIDRVIRSRDGTLRIERVRGSSLMPPGGQLFGDAKLLATFEDTRGVSLKFREQVNASLPPERQTRALVVDFELRELADDWPMGTGLPRRVILRQVRSIEPGSRRVPAEVRALPIPRDVLGRARRVELRTCASLDVELRFHGVNTDALLAPDLGYTATPFTPKVELVFKTAAPALGRAAGEIVTFTHLDFASVQRVGTELVVQLTPSTASAARFSQIRLDAVGSLHVGDASSGIDVTGLTCRTELLFSTPQDYLRSLL